MLERSFDIKFANETANDPAVRPHLGPASLGELDFTDAVNDDHNWFLMGEHGGFILAWSAPGVYEVHVMIKPEGQGAWAAKARQWMLDFAKANGAAMLWARIARSARHVSYFARRGGMKPTGDTVNLFGYPHSIYKMELA